MARTIIKPGPDHVKDCARLIFISGSELYQYVFSGDKDDVLPIIEMYSDTSSTMFSKDKIFIDVQDGMVRGLILGYPTKDMSKMAFGMVFSLGKLLRLCGFSRTMTILSNLKFNNYFPKLGKNEYFISNLAVYETYRGQGVGKGLLQQAEVEATMLGMEKLSLYVEMDNPGAIRLYEKYGFVKTDEVKLPEMFREHHLKGFYKMVKDI